MTTQTNIQMPTRVDVLPVPARVRHIARQAVRLCLTRGLRTYRLDNMDATVSFDDHDTIWVQVVDVIGTRYVVRAALSWSY